MKVIITIIFVSTMALADCAEQLMVDTMSGNIVTVWNCSDD